MVRTDEVNHSENGRREDRTEGPVPMIIEQATRFGRPWTIEMLDILERFLDTFTTVLKKQPFRLVRTPDAIQPSWAERLIRVYGDESWRRLYEPARQLGLFGTQACERESGVEGLVGIYREKLEATFRDRFMKKSRTLRNSSGGPFFELLFCVGNRTGIGPAERVGRHILDHF